MKKKRQVEGYSAGYGGGEITIGKLVFYNLLFIVPIIVLIILSYLIAKYTSTYFGTTIGVTSQILMLFFTLGLFFVLIPIIRRRESIAGVRYSLVGFLIVAIGITLPAIVLQRNFSLLFTELPHIASYVLLTFIYCPEVLGMDIDISKWFKHYKQLFVIFIYCSIVLLYVAGFGWIFYNMARADPSSFNYAVSKPVSYPRYLYFSIISFATIGYGDITPVSTGARFLVCTEAMLGSIVNVIFIAILFVYISNFQAFLQGLKEEERRIKEEEVKLKKEEQRVERLRRRIRH